MCIRDRYLLDIIKDNNKNLGFELDIHWIHPVSYTHLDVYKRQVSVFLGGEPDAGTHPGGGAEGGCAGAAG